MTVLAGVDAGGSHTEVAVSGPDLEPLARHSGPRGSIRRHETRSAALAISATIRSTLNTAEKDPPVDALAVGAAGAGDETARAVLQGELAAQSLAATLLVTTDAHIALESAFPEGEGIVLIAGTGSVAFARDPGGYVVRAGGLGWRLGDEGSGYAVGQMALRAVFRAADGRGESTALTDGISAMVECRDVHSLLQWIGEADRQAIAGLARAVSAAARASDTVARNIVRMAAGDLLAHVTALSKHFSEAASPRVALSGGLLSAGSPVREELAALVEERLPEAIIVEGPVDPVIGALRVAQGLL